MGHSSFVLLAASSPLTPQHPCTHPACCSDCQDRLNLECVACFDCRWKTRDVQQEQEEGSQLSCHSSLRVRACVCESARARGAGACERVASVSSGHTTSREGPPLPVVRVWRQSLSLAGDPVTPARLLFATHTHRTLAPLATGTVRPPLASKWRRHLRCGSRSRGRIQTSSPLPPTSASTNSRDPRLFFCCGLTGHLSCE